jgi:hypothetical protein
MTPPQAAQRVAKDSGLPGTTASQPGQGKGTGEYNDRSALEALEGWSLK